MLPGTHRLELVRARAVRATSRLLPAACIAFHAGYRFHGPILEPIHALFAPDLRRLITEDLAASDAFQPQRVVQPEGTPELVERFP